MARGGHDQAGGDDRIWWQCGRWQCASCTPQAWPGLGEAELVSGSSARLGPHAGRQALTGEPPSSSSCKFISWSAKTRLATARAYYNSSVRKTWPLHRHCPQQKILSKNSVNQHGQLMGCDGHRGDGHRGMNGTHIWHTGRIAGGRSRQLTPLVDDRPVLCHGGAWRSGRGELLVRRGWRRLDGQLRRQRLDARGRLMPEAGWCGLL